MNKKMYKIEFHIHTNASHDSFLNKHLLAFMCKIKKINCVAITDHNEIKNAISYKKFLEKKGIKVIVGEEILTKDGEIIGLFLNKKIQPFLSAIQTIKEIKKQDGIVYVPHPFEPKRSKTVLKYEVIKNNKNLIDFIECHNGRNRDKNCSIKQDEIATNLKIRKIIGSDAHTFYELGRNYCTVNSLEKDELINEIERAYFVKKKCIQFAHFNTKIVRLIKIVKGGKWNELSRIINKKIRKRK